MNVIEEEVMIFNGLCTVLYDYCCDQASSSFLNSQNSTTNKLRVRRSSTPPHVQVRTSTSNAAVYLKCTGDNPPKKGG